MPLIESAFKPTALSRAKAKGVWQFMRGTALENGLKHDWYIDERSDPGKGDAWPRPSTSRRCTACSTTGIWRWRRTTAGPAACSAPSSGAAASDFWALTATSRYLPRETRDYVPMILAAVIIAKNPVEVRLRRRAARRARPSRP